jgi:hypothetical protein
MVSPGSPPESESWIFVIIVFYAALVSLLRRFFLSFKELTGRARL